MKKIILCAIAISSLLMASCDGINTNANTDYIKRKNGIIMVGNKPYKLIVGELDYCYFKMIVPADSSVSIIPANTTYQNGKQTESVLYVR